MAKGDKTEYDNDATVTENFAAVGDAEETAYESGCVFDEGADPGKKGAFIEKGTTLLGTYRVESDAIEGGMGKVWRVRHTGWDVDLAMKQPKAALFETQRQKDNFVHECEAWINLGLHPNIVSCYYIRELGGVPAIFSEWMDGGSLKDAIEDGRLYTVGVAQRILDIAIQFARGLHYAHEQGLIHQDVKPDNLLLSGEGDAKVADFGIARARGMMTVLQEDTTADKTMLSAGGGYTPAYCSMEQMDGQKLTRRTDIYSWAVSVLEMYLGERPWANGAIAGAACDSYFPEARVAVPEAMKALLKECLNENEAARPHDFAAIGQRLLVIYKAETGSDYTRAVSSAAADTADSLNNRALSYLDLGKPEAAAKCWEKALAYHSGHPESVYNESLSLWKHGEITCAQTQKRLETIGDAGQRTRMLSLLEKDAGRFEAFSVKGLRELLPEQYQNVVTQGISRDGIRLSGQYTQGDACILFVYDVRSGTILFSKKAPDQQQGAPRYRDSVRVNIRLSEDGALAIISERGNSDSGRVFIWRISDNQCVFKGTLAGGRLSPDNRFYVAQEYKGGNEGYEVKVFRLGDEEPAHVFERCALLDPCCRWFTEDGRLILVKNENDWIITNMDGSDERLFTGHGDAAVDFRFWYFLKPVVNTVIFSRGRALSAAADFTVRLWDVQTGALIRTFRNPEYEETRHEGIMHLACFLNGGGYIFGLQGQYARVWNAETGQLMDSFACSMEDHEKIQALYGHPVGTYLPRDPSPYAVCRIESTDVRLESDSAFKRLLDDAESSYRAGRSAEALALADKAMRLSGYERNLRAIRLRHEFGAEFRKTGVRAIVAAAGETAPGKPTPETVPDQELTAAAKQELERLRTDAGDDVYSEYKAHLGGACLSRDGRRLFYLTEVDEERDSPAQSEIEVTEWHGAIVFDRQEGTLLRSFACLYQKDAYGSAYPHTVSFDNSGDRLLAVSNGLSVAHISDGRTERLIERRTIRNAAFLPDDRHIFCLDDQNTAFIFDTIEKREIGSAYFNGVKDAWLCDGNSFALAMSGGDIVLCLIDWEYEDVQSVGNK